MYARVYLNTAMSVLTSLNINSRQKQRFYALLHRFIPLKNTLLPYRLIDYLRQKLVFNQFMRDAQ